MRFSLKQLLLVSISLGQVINTAARAVPVQNGVQTVQLDARGPLNCCGSPAEAAPPSDIEPAQPEGLVTEQPGPNAPLEIPLVPVEPTEPEVPQAPKPEPITPPKVATPPIADAAKQAAAEAKGADLLAGKVPTKSFPPYTASYELKDQKTVHLSAKSRDFLEVPLKGNAETMSSAFDQFAFYSKTPPDNKLHLPTLRAGFIKNGNGISIEFMSKEYDGAGLNKIPTSELLAQGAKTTNSKPTFVYMKKIANPDTKAFIQDALNEKGADDWTLSSTATDVSEQKWFKTLLGSDNGRPIQQMCLSHPDLTDGKTVTSIYISTKDVQKMALTIG